MRNKELLTVDSQHPTPNSGLMRAWIALALLSASWLLGLDYYHPANWPAWTVVVVLAWLMFCSRPPYLGARRETGVALSMFLPAVWFMPWPYRAAPLLVAIGLALQILPVPRRWPRPLGWGAVKAGVVLLGQSLAMLAYAAQTARCHDLPRPLATLIGGVASLLGIDAAVHANTVAMHSLREIHERAAIHYLAATWELLVDPATLCFFVGGLILLAVTAWSTLPEGTRWTRWVRSVRLFALVTVVWLPVRAGLLMALYLNRVLLANSALRPTAMNQFLSPWVALMFLLGPVLLAWWFVRMSATTEVKNLQSSIFNLQSSILSRWRYPAALVLVGCAAAVSAFAVQWHPVGRRKTGRVMVVERHSTWEPTDRPYDKNHFGHDPSYSYTRLYDYCAQFYEMSRLAQSDRISDQSLARCDVLVIKIPTERYTPDEIRAVVRFVRSGGGVLFVGDHTNVFYSTTYLNELTRPFGFVFRHDVLFRIGSPYVELHEWPAVPHPIVQHLPPTHFAGSCSIDPGRSWGRAAVTGTGLWSAPPDYHAENTFFPQAEYRPVMRYGAFVQLWATGHGKGRVLAFGDSTVFSNFSIFEPGKAEFFVGMLEWLNRRSALDDARLRVPLAVLGLVAAVTLLAAGLLMARAAGVAWPGLVGAGVLGWTLASMAVVEVHRASMPRPKPVRPMVRVMVDRTVSEVPLSLGGFTEPDGRSYALFEQWIWRLGYSSQRASGQEAFAGDALVVICPTRSVTREFREGLVEYVAAGGNVLIVDSPDVAGSTANSLLWPFKMGVNHAVSPKGELRLADDWPGLEIQASCEILGGEPFMWVGDTPVAARADYGKGSVMVIGFGSLLNDNGMGMSWMRDPDAELLTRFDVLFALVEALVEGRPVAAPPPRRSEPTE